MQSESWARKSKIQGDFRFDVVNMIVLGLITLLFFYPMYLCLISAVSSPEEVYAGRVLLFPKGFNSEGFQRVIENDSLWRGYLNTIFYTVLGTCINLALTMTGAFVLSRRTFALRTPLNWMVLFTMFFGGGMIPTYLLVKDLKLLNTVWSLVLPGAISTWNLIITRTFLATSIPNELFESAYIDGATEWQTFLKIALPLSGAIIAVMALYAAVGTWGSWYTAFIYITDQKKWPLQLRLRQILILNQTQSLDYGMMSQEEIEMLQHQAFMVYTMKYAIIFIACAPMLVLYPFVQKYFVKGVMIGSLKG